MYIRTSLLFSFLFLLFAPQVNAKQSASAVDSVVVVGIKPAPPFIIDNPSGTLSGMSVYLWDKMTSEGNIQFEYKRYEDIPSLIEGLKSGEVDLTINPLTVTESRLKEVDFAQPYYISSMGLAMRKEGSLMPIIKNLFTVGFLKAVGALAVVLLFFGFLMWLAERKKNPEEFPAGPKGIGEGFWWSAVTMTTVGYGDKAPVSFAGRVVGFIWMFAALIFFSGITAGIASALTVSSLNQKISGLNDLVNFKTGTIKGSSSESYLEENRIKYVEFNSVSEALDALDNKNIDALLYDKPILHYYIQEKDLEKDMQVLNNSFSQDYYAFAFPKGGTLDSALNPILLQQINADYWKTEKQKYVPEDDN